MSREKMDLLIAELGQSVGVDLALDDDAAVLLAVDEDLAVALRFDESTGILILQTSLDTVEPSPAQLQRALAANFCWQETMGETFGFDPLTGRLTLMRRVLGDGIDLTGLTAALEGLLNHNRLWATLLGELALPAPEAEAEAEPTPAHPAVAGLRA